jgi:hypothetical protein
MFQMMGALVVLGQHFLRPGLVVMPDGSFNTLHRAQIILLAARNNVPAVYFAAQFGRDGRTPSNALQNECGT